MGEDFEEENDFGYVRVIIPDEIEESEDDPIAWWVDECIGVLQENSDGESYSLEEVAIVVLLLADNENALRRTGNHTGKVSPVDWNARLERLTKGRK